MVDVTEWEVHLYEVDGLEEKIWLAEPGTDRKALFKPNLRHDNAQQADHWPEKLASEIAGLLGVPAAFIDLAVREGRRGCLSYDVKPDGWQLQPGWLLLAQLLGEHDPMDREHRGHTLSNIFKVLEGYAPPPGFTGPASFTAFGVFIGYVAFDALIANRDRHPANWSVLLGPGEDDQRLAPSYDHATSLGFSLTDVVRLRKLGNEREWEAFLRKGTAHRFEGGRKLPLTDFAREALEVADAEVRGYWLDRVDARTKDQIVDLAGSVSEMSDVARTFAMELVDANRRRLLDG